MILPRSFYQRSAEQVAQELLGNYLVLQGGSEVKVGKITETEAYPEHDPASQTFRGQTKRNQVLFGSPGKLYIYMTYGMHFCINVVTGELGEGSGVLIRAVEPIKGVSGKTDGPAKLTKAYGLNLMNNGDDLIDGMLTIRSSDEFGSKPVSPSDIKKTPRIGISKNTEALLRFTI